MIRVSPASGVFVESVPEGVVTPYSVPSEGLPLSLDTSSLQVPVLTCNRLHVLRYAFVSSFRYGFPSPHRSVFSVPKVIWDFLFVFSFSIRSVSVAMHTSGSYYFGVSYPFSCRLVFGSSDVTFVSNGNFDKLYQPNVDTVVST